MASRKPPAPPGTAPCRPEGQPKIKFPISWGCSLVQVDGNTLIGEPTGKIEVVDYTPDIATNGVIKAAKAWNILKGSMRTGMK